MYPKFEYINSNYIISSMFLKNNVNNEMNESCVGNVVLSLKTIHDKWKFHQNSEYLFYFRNCN